MPFLTARACILFLLTSFALLINGCASLADKKTTPNHSTLGDHPLYDHQWVLEGKLAIKQAGSRNTAFIRWEQNQDQLRLSLTGAMGQGLTQILSNSEKGATLIYKQQRTYYKNLDTLFYEHLGWNFSVDQVKYWLTGRRHEENAQETKTLSPRYLTTTGQPLTFEQNNWKVDIQKWHTLKNTQLLAPKKIIFSYPSYALEPELTLLLVIKKWIPNPSLKNH